jgi:hypothetical protein
LALEIPHLLNSVNLALFKNRAFLLSLVRENPSIYPYLPKEFAEDPDFIRRTRENSGLQG